MDRSLDRKAFVATLGVAGVGLGVSLAGAGVSPVVARQAEPMRFLDVPGARLHYATQGSGPLLLFVPGAAGSVPANGAFPAAMAEQYTVVTYDRRGFSRSRLAGAQDYARRLETDADDVRLLIEHLGDGPATIFGSSSGAIVALEALARCPSVVRMLVAHEPPAVKLLPDGQRWLDFFFRLYDQYRESGTEPALETFRESFTESDRQAMARSTDVQADDPILVNTTYWFERELRQYPAVDLDLDALAEYADRIVLVAGRESSGRPSYEVTVELGKRLGREVTELPGGHVGFLSDPDAFVPALRQALERVGQESDA